MNHIDMNTFEYWDSLFKSRPDYDVKAAAARYYDTVVEHPKHYGGEDNPYETIKVIEAWGLNFNTGNAVKYISRAGKKEDYRKDIQKAIWYLKREIGE